MRARDGEPDVCVNCYRMPEAVCTVCGRRRPCNFADTEQPICKNCTPRATARCAHCGQDHPPTVRWDEGPLCDPCYITALRRRGRCDQCGAERRLVAPPGPAATTCADCAGLPAMSVCVDCGLEDKMYERGRCARCSLRRRTSELLGAGTDAIPSDLISVFEAITAAQTPRSALNWLRKGAGAAALAEVAAGRLAATHQALDAHPHRRAADYLRHMLVAGGVLPPRDEDLARTEQWLAGRLQTVDAGTDRRLVQAFATWRIMRRLRRRSETNTGPRTYTAHARRRVRAATEFLTWLRGRDLTLASCGQRDVDEWLTAGPAGYDVRDFLTWAAEHNHCQDLHVPGPQRRNGAATDQDKRWALVARLLHDQTLDPTDRVAGCLLLLYGQQLSRIAVMTTDQIINRDGTVFVRFGRNDVPVPEPLGAVLTELVHSGRPYLGVGSPTSTPWLFPGGLPGRPITAARLGERLRTLGVRALPGRRATLVDLAAQLPAAVLADLLRLAPTTAVRWMREAGGDWSSYAAQIARSRHHQP